MNGSKRYLSIEFFKALGIIYLVCLHEVAWIFMDFSSGGFRYEELRSVGIIFGYYSGLHVLGFQIPLLAGMTYYMAFKSKNTTFTFVWKRAVVLLLLGYMVNFLCWGWRSFFDWDVLQFIALSMIVSFPLLKKFPQHTGPFMVFVVGCVALSYSSLYPLLSLEHLYIYQIIIGSRIGENFWPFCPWFFLFAVGVGMGKAYYENNTKMIKIFPFIGLVLLAVSILSGKFFPTISTEHVWSALLFKPSPFFVCGIAGASLTMIPLASLIFSRFPSLKNIVQNSPLMDLGRGILCVFLFNTIVGYRVTSLVLTIFEINYKQAIGVLAVLIAGTLVAGYYLSKAIYPKKNIEYITGIQ